MPTKEQITAVVDASLHANPSPTGQVLNVLNDVRAAFGYVPTEALSLLSECISVPYEQLQAVCDFFHDLSTTPLGEHVIEVCDGTACHTKGAPELVQLLEQTLGIKVGQTTPDGKYTLKTVHCVGSCSLAPVLLINTRTSTKTIGRVRLSDVVQTVKRLT